MTFEELRSLCDEGPFVHLTLPRRSLPKGNRVRLTGKAGPLGELGLVKESDHGYEVVVRFESASILRWLDRKGLGN